MKVPCVRDVRRHGVDPYELLTHGGRDVTRGNDDRGGVVLGHEVVDGLLELAEFRLDLLLRGLVSEHGDVKRPQAVGFGERVVVFVLVEEGDLVVQRLLRTGREEGGEDGVGMRVSVRAPGEGFGERSLGVEGRRRGGADIRAVVAERASRPVVPFSPIASRPHARSLQTDPLDLELVGPPP